MFVVLPIEIGIRTSIEPPSVSIICCTIVAPFVIIAVFCGKHHTVVNGKGIFYKWIIDVRKYTMKIQNKQLFPGLIKCSL